jgi:hypothetical protein
VAVLQFNVTLNSDVSVGSVEGLTLLQDGMVNGQLKYTAISDNYGALTFTPGMVPSNSGNAAIDGSVTAVTLPGSSVVAQPVVAPKHTSGVVVSRVGVSVHPVTPVRVTSANTTPTPVALAGVDTLVTVISVDTTVITSDAAMVNNNNLSTPAMPPMASAVVTVAPEAMSLTAVATSTAKPADSSVSLSLAAVGTNKAAGAASTPTTTGKASTVVLDEVYRLLGTASLNGIVAGTDGDDAGDAISDLWDLESLLNDQD